MTDRERAAREAYMADMVNGDPKWEDADETEREPYYRLTDAVMYALGLCTQEPQEQGESVEAESTAEARASSDGATAAGSPPVAPEPGSVAFAICAIEGLHGALAYRRHVDELLKLLDGNGRIILYNLLTTRTPEEEQ